MTVKEQSKFFTKGEVAIVVLAAFTSFLAGKVYEQERVQNSQSQPTPAEVAETICATGVIFDDNPKQEGVLKEYGLEAAYQIYRNGPADPFMTMFMYEQNDDEPFEISVKTRMPNQGEVRAVSLPLANRHEASLKVTQCDGVYVYDADILPPPKP